MRAVSCRICVLPTLRTCVAKGVGYEDPHKLTQHRHCNVYLDAICVAPHTQLWMLAHASLNDLCNVLQSRPKLLGAVVAQRNVVAVGWLKVWGNESVREGVQVHQLPCLQPTVYVK